MPSLYNDLFAIGKGLPCSLSTVEDKQSEVNIKETALPSLITDWLPLNLTDDNPYPP